MAAEVKDGQVGDISEKVSENRGLLYGDGLFETLRVCAGRPLFVDRHLDRFRGSAQILGLDEELVRRACAAMERPEIDGDGLFRVTAIRGGEGVFGGGEGGVFTRSRPLPPQRPYRLTVVAGTYFPGDGLAELKTTSWLRSVMARRTAEERGFDEAVMCTTCGRVGEASAANVFARIQGRWVTPVVRGILPGVVRGVVLNRASALGLRVEEAVMTVAELLAAEAVAITSTGRLVSAVVAVDEVTFDAAPVGELRRLVEEA